MKAKYPHKFKIPWLKKTTKSRKVPKRADIPKGMKATYNILQTPKVIEAFHPQFIGISRNAIDNIEDRNDAIVIKSKPVKASITFFRGRIPITHINLKKVI
jgi:hypothetical protein